jgi:hypothetical protein
VNGTEVRKLRILHHKTQIDPGGLPAGVYFLQLKNDHLFEVGKMIKE